MAAEGTSWADQWGEGGFGVIPEVRNEAMTREKMAAPTSRIGKAMAGLQRVGNGPSRGIKWLKSKCKKKTTATME